MASMVIKGLNHCSTFKNTVQKIVLELSFDKCTTTIFAAAHVFYTVMPP